MHNMTRLLDILDRAEQGPICDVSEFDMKYVAEGVARAVKKHGIRFDKSRIIQTDDAMMDRVWEAAVEFFEECGVYNTSTGRRMLFTRREIEEGLRWAPKEVLMGEGNDVRRMVTRTMKDPRPPLIVGGAIGVPMREDMHDIIMQSYMQEPVIDTIAAGTLETIYGREARTRSPMEIVACWEHIDRLLTVARRVGRPGLCLGAVSMSWSDIGHLSAISRGGYRPTDRHNIAMVGELKTNYELMNKVAHSVRQDGVILGFYNPIFGGLAGGEEGLAVVLTAGFIGLQLIYMAAMQCTCPTHPFLFNDTAPQILRAVSAAIGAMTRNSHLMTMVMTSPVGGPGTDTVLYESVAMATTATVCGAAGLMGVRSAVGVHPNHASGLEARFNGEVGHAAAGLDREQAEYIVQQAVARYEPVMNTKPIGKPFWEVYDTLTVKPKPEWLAIYDRVKEEAASWGLPIR